MEENLKAALKYAVDLRDGQKVIYKEEDKTYYDSNKAALRELSPIKYATTLTTKSLSGLVDYLKSKFDDSVNTPEGRSRIQNKRNRLAIKYQSCFKS